MEMWQLHQAIGAMS